MIKGALLSYSNHRVLSKFLSTLPPTVKPLKDSDLCMDVSYHFSSCRPGCPGRCSAPSYSQAVLKPSFGYGKPFLRSTPIILPQLGHSINRLFCSSSLFLPWTWDFQVFVSKGWVGFYPAFLGILRVFKMSSLLLLEWNISDRFIEIALNLCINLEKRDIFINDEYSLPRARYLFWFCLSSSIWLV